MVAAVVLAVVLFVSTDIDDLFVLIAFFADRRLRASDIAIGQYLGILALFALSALASLASLIVPEAYIGSLGFVPIFMGVRGLVSLARGDPEADESSLRRGGIVEVAAATIANGGDNVAVYTPVFAIHSRLDIAIMALTFFAMTALWLAVARWLVDRRRISASIDRHGRWAVPVVLIGLGLSILWRAGSFALIGRAFG